jgi:hypothetical protein
VFCTVAVGRFRGSSTFFSSANRGIVLYRYLRLLTTSHNFPGTISSKQLRLIFCFRSGAFNAWRATQNKQGDSMNTKHFTKGLLFGASLLLASAAFAGEKASVRVYEDVKVNGKALAPGKYELAWEGTGSAVQVSIRRGNTVVATIPAAIETAKSAPTTSGYSTKTETDGSKELTSVFFAGKKVSLNLDQQAATASPQAASTAGNK